MSDRQLNMNNLIRKIYLERDRYINNRRKAEHPLQQLFWECTLKCNLKCLHCGSDCKVNEEQQDMPLQDFLSVLDNLSDHVNPQHVLVITTGGEPLVRHDIIECGREITRRGFLWGMVSNGMLLSSQMIDNLMEAGLKTIAISLDGFKEEHNWMRGHDNSFDRAINAIKSLSHRHIVWDVITCVNKRNYKDLDAFKEFLLSIGVRQWRIFTVFPAGRAKDNDDLQLTPEQIRGVMEFIVRTRKEKRINLCFSCEGFLGDYEFEVRDHSYFCQAGIHVASILADGSISGCLSIRSNFHQGNIYRDNFWEVWNSRFEQYRNREWAKTDACTDCEMWRYCEGNGMHLRDENGNLIMCNYKNMQE